MSSGLNGGPGVRLGDGVVGAKRMTWAKVLGGVLVLVAVGWFASCSREGVGCGSAPAVDAVVDASSVPSSEPRLTCASLGEGTPLGDLGEAVFGTSVVHDGRLVLGVTLKGEQILVSFSIREGSLGAPSRIVVDKVHGDAPPPRPIRLAGELAVAWFSSGKDRALKVAPVLQGTAGAVTVGATIATVAMSEDDSFAFDVGGAVGSPWVAWDDAEGGRGVVRIQIGAGERKTITPDTSDAEGPVLATMKGRTWAVWLAERVQKEHDGGARGPEGPAEDRASRWIEAAMLDGSGARQGEPVVIGSTTGHVHAFSVLSDEARAALLVVAAEETERSEGEGGRIVSYLVRDKGAEAPTELLTKGFGRANFDVFGAGKASGAPWVAFEDVVGRQRVGRFGADRKIVWDGEEADGGDGRNAPTTKEIGRFLAEDGELGLFALTLAGAQPAVSRFRCRP